MARTLVDAIWILPIMALLAAPGGGALGGIVGALIAIALAPNGPVVGR